MYLKTATCIVCGRPASSGAVHGGCAPWLACAGRERAQETRGRAANAAWIPELALAALLIALCLFIAFFTAKRAG